MPRRTIEGEGKKSPLNMKTTAVLRAKLEAACGESGRSLVQEVEYRLEQSFAADALQGGKYSELPRLITLAMMLGPKGTHRAKALQCATRIICDVFFAKGLSAEAAHNMAMVAHLQGDPAEISGHSIAMAVLEQAGLASPPTLFAAPPPKGIDQ